MRAYTLLLAIALCRMRRRPCHGRSWNGTYETESLKSSKRLGDEFEKFIDIRNMQTHL